MLRVAASAAEGGLGIERAQHSVSALPKSSALDETCAAQLLDEDCSQPELIEYALLDGGRSLR